MASRAVCALCQSDEGKMNAVGEKGLRTILRASYEKQEDDIYERLMILKDKSSPLYVHNDCRRKLVDLRKKPLPEVKKIEVINRSCVLLERMLFPMRQAHRCKFIYFIYSFFFFILLLLLLFLFFILSQMKLQNS